MLEKLEDAHWAERVQEVFECQGRGLLGAEAEIHPRHDVSGHEKEGENEPYERHAGLDTINDTPACVRCDDTAGQWR